MYYYRCDVPEPCEKKETVARSMDLDTVSPSTRRHTRSMEVSAYKNNELPLDLHYDRYK